MGTLFLTTEARICKRARTTSSISGARKTGQLRVKEWNWSTNSNLISRSYGGLNLFFLRCLHTVIHNDCKLAVPIYIPTNRARGLPSAGKIYTHEVGDLGSIPGFGGSPGEGKAYPLQYSALDNLINCIVKSQEWLSDFHFKTMQEGFPFLHSFPNIYCL